MFRNDIEYHTYEYRKNIVVETRFMPREQWSITLPIAIEITYHKSYEDKKKWRRIPCKTAFYTNQRVKEFNPFDKESQRGRPVLGSKNFLAQARQINQASRQMPRFYTLIPRIWSTRIKILHFDRNQKPFWNGVVSCMREKWP